MEKTKLSFSSGCQLEIPSWLGIRAPVHFALSVLGPKCWAFDGDCIESVDCIWEDGRFHYVNPTDP